MGIYKYLKISISIIFSFSLLAFTFSASAQKVLQCAPGMATVNNNLTVNGNLQVNNNATVANDLTVNKDIFAASGVQRIYLGPDTASPYIANNLNGGEGILFYSNGGQNFLWQSPNGTPGSDAMILKATPGLPTNNNFNLQVYGQVSPYQLHTMGIHLDMQGGVGSDPDGNGPATNPNILKITNSDNNSTPAQGGAAVFHGNTGAWGQGNLVFAGIDSATGAINPKMVINTVSGNVGIGTINPQITLAIGENDLDNDTGLKWISDGNIAVYTNNAERIRIDSSGNIGIGTITPGAKLEVAGQIKITGGAPALGKVLTSDANGLATWESVPGAVESDPIWATASANYYTQTNLQTSGQSSVHWGNLTNIPAEGDPSVGTVNDGQWCTGDAAGTVNCTIAAPSFTEADTLNSVTGRGNTTANSIIVGGLTVDTNTLYVDSVNNRVGIGVVAPNTKLHINAPAGSDVFRLQANNDTKMFMDDTGFVGIGAFFTPSNALDVIGNIEADDILNQSQRSLLSTVYINSDNNGNPTWTSDILTIDDTTSNGGWYWALDVSTRLSQPVLGFRLRGSSDDGGVCQIWVTGLFAANITNRGYSSAYTLDGGWPAGGSFANNGAGGMGSGTSFIFSSLATGENLFQASDTDLDGNPDTIIDDWGYLKPVGLDIIPEGMWVNMRGGRADGAATEYVRCYLDVLYATQYKPN